MDELNLSKDKKKEKQKDLLQAGIVGASYETIQRYGAAIKEHKVAFSGIDNETNTLLKKSLKSIRDQRTNDENAFSIRQQKAGFAAEVKDTANTNAEKIINGNPTRKIRHDDIPGTPANHPLIDHVCVDSKGDIIPGSGSQMKIIGASANDPKGLGNAERTLKKLLSKDFQKYIDNDVKIEVLKDEYPQIKVKIDENIDSLQKQLEKTKANENLDAVAKIEKKIDNLNKIKKNLIPNTLTRKETHEAVDSPIISTAKSVASISHRAGIETAKSAALIGGSVSIVKNVVGMLKDEIEVEDAIENVLKDTAQATAVGYVTGSAGSVIKGAMQNSTSECTRALAKTNVPGMIVAFTISASKTLKRYFSGEIDGAECLETLGEQGTSMIASSMFGAIGQIAIPIPFVGGLIGGMVGYALSSASYGVLLSSLKGAKIAREKRIAIEAECEKHIKMIREYRSQMNSIINEYLLDSMNMFNESFSRIEKAVAIGDFNLLIESANDITDSFGGKKPFESMDDFNNKMRARTTFNL